MTDLSNLSWRQRIHRRVSLLGGSYEHPDGHLELDFEEPAGIDGRNDSKQLQTQKLIAYEKRQEASRLKVFYLIAGAALMYAYLKYF
jgi:hypothetical protein